MTSRIIEFNDIYPAYESWQELDGKIGFYTGSGNSWVQNRFKDKPSICISYHSQHQWIPIALLSGANLKKYRENIESYYGLLYKKYIGGKKRITKLKENANDNGDEAFMAHLWSSYDSRVQRDVMQEMLNQFHKFFQQPNQKQGSFHFCKLLSHQGFQVEPLIYT